VVVFFLLLCLCVFFGLVFRFLVLCFCERFGFVGFFEWFVVFVLWGGSFARH